RLVGRERDQGGATIHQKGGPGRSAGIRVGLQDGGLDLTKLEVPHEGDPHDAFPDRPEDRHDRQRRRNTRRVPSIGAFGRPGWRRYGDNRDRRSLTAICRPDYWLTSARYRWPARLWGELLSVRHSGGQARGAVGSHPAMPIGRAPGPPNLITSLL